MKAARPGLGVGLARFEHAGNGEALVLTREEGGDDLVAPGQLALHEAEVGPRVLLGLAPDLLAGEVDIHGDQSLAVRATESLNLLQ